MEAEKGQEQTKEEVGANRQIAKEEAENENHNTQDEKLPTMQEMRKAV